MWRIDELSKSEFVFPNNLIPRLGKTKAVSLQSNRFNSGGMYSHRGDEKPLLQPGFKRGVQLCGPNPYPI